MTIEITSEPIDYTALTESVRCHNAGAVVLFMGTVREMTGCKQTTLLEYEALSLIHISEPTRPY